MAPGLKRLIEKRRAEFRQPENINHYSEDDYKIAERKYVKFRLNGWGPLRCDTVENGGADTAMFQ